MFMVIMRTPAKEGRFYVSVIFKGRLFASVS